MNPLLRSRRTRWIVLLAAIGGLAAHAGGHPAPGIAAFAAAVDPADGAVFTFQGNRLEKRIGASLAHQRTLEAAQTAGAVVDSNGNLVLAFHGAADGELRVLDAELEHVRSIALEQRPIAVAAAGDAIVVLTTAVEGGWSVALYDDAYRPSGGFPVDFADCPMFGVPGIVDLEASGADAIYVAHLACQGSYRVRQYDSNGNIRQDLSPATSSGAPPAGNRIRPGATDLFVLDGKIGLILNERARPGGAKAVLWSADGAMSGPVSLPEVSTSIVTVLPRGDGKLVVANRVTGQLQEIERPLDWR